MADPVYLDPGAGYDNPAGVSGAGYVTSQGQGDKRNFDAAAFKVFQDVFGRNPTQDELNQALPAFQTAGDPHTANLAQGRAFVSQLHQATSNTPDQLYADQQAKYLADAPKHADDVNNLFQSTLGRQASQDELNHFGSLLASGTTDKYQLQNFLQQQPEYTQKQDQNFRSGLSSELQGYDKTYFQNQVLPSIQEAYAKQGRSFDSSAFQNAATQAAQQQNTGREQYLAQLSASQYGGRQQNAYNDYANYVQNQQGLTNSGINAQYTGIQNAISRSNNIQDFNTQAQLYNQYLAKYGKRSNNGIGGLIGGGIGAGVGAYFGGPTGAAAGYQVGSGLGNAGQNAFGGSY